MNGWIKLHRKISDWEWYQDSKTFHLFMHLVIHARHKNGAWKGTKLERGQVVTGVNALSGATGISVRSIRTCLKRLEDSGEISLKSTNRFTIVTICKYDDYQAIDSDDRHSNDIQTTSQRQTNDIQTTTTEECKEGENGKENKSGQADKGKNPPEVLLKKTEELRRISEKMPDWISVELWAELITNRKMKKLSNSDLALATLLNALKKGTGAGYSIEECIGEYVQSGWKRFNVEWMPKRPGLQGQEVLQPRNIREAHAIQCSQIAKALNDEHNREQGINGGSEFNGGEEGGLFLEPPF